MPLTLPSFLKITRFKLTRHGMAWVVFGGLTGAWALPAHAGTSTVTPFQSDRSFHYFYSPSAEALKWQVSCVHRFVKNAGGSYVPYTEASRENAQGPITDRADLKDLGVLREDIRLESAPGCQKR